MPVTVKKSPTSTAKLAGTSKHRLILSSKAKIVLPKCSAVTACSKWIAGGTYDPVSHGGALGFAGPKAGKGKNLARIRFVAGGRQVLAKNLSVKLNDKTGSMSIATGVFFGSNGSKQDLTSGNLLRLSSCQSTRQQAEIVAIVKCRANISSPGARLLKKKLKTTAFKRGVYLGKLTFVLRLQRRAVAAGQTELALSQEFLADIASAGITVAAELPATGSTARPGPGRFKVPLKPGSAPFDVPDPALIGGLPHEGALILTAATTSQRLSGLTLSPHGAAGYLALASAFSGPPPPPTPVIIGSASNTTPPSQTDVLVSPGTYAVTMGSAFAAALNARFHVDVFTPGQAFGTFTPSAVVE